MSRVRDRLRHWLARGHGSAADARCAVCSVMVTPKDRIDYQGDTYCSQDHYEQGIADHAW